MISVVVTLFNGEKFIKEQLNSIRMQTNPVDEVIIVDDASTDDSTKITNSFINYYNLYNWKLIINKTNLGFAYNFIKGIKKCTGNVIFLCDQDDIWNPDKVKIMYNIMDKNQQLMVLSSRYSLIDQNGKKINKNPGVVNYAMINDGSIANITPESLIGSSYIRGCAMCFRKEIVEMIPDLELKNLLGHDWIINILSALIGENQCVNLDLFQYRIHTSNVSLSAVNRKTLLGDCDKRIKGLQESINAYIFIYNNLTQYKNSSKRIAKKIKKQIAFERKRLQVIKNRSLRTWISLLISLSCYKQYYNSVLGGIKIYFGDLFYAFNINFNIK